MQRLCLLMPWRRLRRVCPAGRLTLPALVGARLLPRLASICVLRTISEGWKGFGDRQSRWRKSFCNHELRCAGRPLRCSGAKDPAKNSRVRRL